MLIILFSFGNNYNMYFIIIMPIRNHHGIFWNKKAKNLAIQYNLDLNSTYAYGVNNNYVKLRDVEFIVHNLWIEHFVNSTPKPIQLNDHNYFMMYNKLLLLYPHFFINNF